MTEYGELIVRALVNVESTKRWRDGVSVDRAGWGGHGEVVVFLEFHVLTIVVGGGYSGHWEGLWLTFLFSFVL